MGFKENLQIEFDNIVKEKNGLSYIPWATAIAKFKEVYPDGDYMFVPNKEIGNFLFGDKETGYMVKTAIMFDGKTYDWQLPVLDFRNKPVFEPNVMDINKAQMRCLTKNIAVATGIGLPIYAGEEFQGAEVNVEIKELRGNITNLAREIYGLDKNKASETKRIIGHAGQVDKIKEVEEAKQVYEELLKVLESVKNTSKKTTAKKTTTKKTEEK